MAINKAKKIWMNGKWVAWDDARIHVLSHVAHYASSVFEGIRCYVTRQGRAIGRALGATAAELGVTERVHIRRLTALMREPVRQDIGHRGRGLRDSAAEAVR